MIKSVGQAIPTYVMGVFKLSIGLCEDLTKIMRECWWGTENGKNKMQWIAWDTMMRPKSCVGICFRDLHLFIQALLAWQAW